MNILNSYNDILGCTDTNFEKKSFHSFFYLLKQIRDKLGKQGYLLDSYVSLFLDSVNHTLASDSAERGFQASTEYQYFCFDILDCPDKQKQHPLFSKAIDVRNNQLYIDNFQERHTQMCLLHLALEDVFFAYTYEQFLAEKISELYDILDIVQLRELYSRISKISDESMLEKLNLKLHHMFLISPSLISYKQGFVNDLIYKLIYRDNETSRQIFQLVLDNY